MAAKLIPHVPRRTSCGLMLLPSACKAGAWAGNWDCDSLGWKKNSSLDLQNERRITEHGQHESCEKSLVNVGLVNVGRKTQKTALDLLL